MNKITKAMMGVVVAGLLASVQNPVQAATHPTKQITVTKRTHIYDLDSGSIVHIVGYSDTYAKGKKVYILGFKKIHGKRFAKLTDGTSAIPVANTNYRNKKLNYKTEYSDPSDIVKKTPRKKKTSKKVVYKENHIVLPSTYTMKNFEKGYDYHGIWFYKIAGKQGVKMNKFTPESKADNVKVDPDHLTASQQKELSLFAMRLINDARTQLKIAPLRYTERAQKLANDVAKEYEKDDFSFGVYKANATPEEIISNHDVPALIRAAAENGLHISQNTIENGATMSEDPETLTDMKRQIFNSIRDMIMGKNDTYIEFGHANGLLDANIVYTYYDEDGQGITDPEQQAKADEVANKEFAMSFSAPKDGGWNDYHFISFNKYCEDNVPRPW